MRPLPGTLGGIEALLFRADVMALPIDDENRLSNDERIQKLLHEISNSHINYTYNNCQITANSTLYKR